MAFDTTSLLSRWRLRSVLDGTETDYPDATGLDLCDQVIVEEITPRIIAKNADYFETHVDVAVTSGRHRYPIPSRAFLGKINSLYMLNASKTGAVLLYFTDQRLIGLQQSGSPTDHVIADNSIVLGSIPSTAGYLRIYYPYRPSQLVATAACMLITGRSGGQLTGTPVGTWTTNDRFDVVSGTSPFELIHASLTASSVTGGVTFTESELDTDRLDDGGTYYVALERQTCFPMVPEEFHRLIAELASCPVLENQGDEGWSNRYNVSHKKLEEIASACIVRKETEHKPQINQWSFMDYFADDA